ncbi:MAG: hypothetical protein P0Y64_16615 [Candidatus Sphingomonas colombiensis]|nr:hypothetical protein [Sphingomonas sp.]WEK42942.1 MAG: hypothetical protein P0Y64_16615 [Sphingomonas sp.]
MASQAIAERPRTAADILGSSGQSRGVARSQATTIEQSRAIAEVQAAVVVAQSHPRDKARALNEALESCRTREVAENAFFKFPRGGQSVSGETIHLARELARCWGNIDYKIAELSRDDEGGSSEMMAIAWDLETNSRASLTFIVPHLRDKRGGAERLTDVRDIYENNANMGARRLRECIFAVLPKYLVQAASDECRNTLETRNAEVPLTKRIADALTAFAKIGIDKSRIEAKLGATGNFTAVDLANLQISYKSIARNEISAEDEFPRIEGAAPSKSKLDMLQDAIQSNDGALSDDNPIAHEGRADEDHGDQHDGGDE